MAEEAECFMLPTPLQSMKGLTVLTYLGIGELYRLYKIVREKVDIKVNVHVDVNIKHVDTLIYNNGGNENEKDLR